MSLFGSSKPKTFLGVDIGGSSIKVVELANEKGRARLMTYGYLELPPQDGGDGLFDQPKKAGEFLARVCKESDVKATQAMTALQSSNVFSTILSLPKSKDPKMIKPLIDAELGKLAPLPVNEMITYSTMIDGEAKADKGEVKTKEMKEDEKEKSKYTRVLVTGAAKTLVSKYIEIFKTAKLNLQAIDTESFALIRALIGKDKGAIMILDLGSKRTNLFIVEKGIPFVSRSINLGGDSVTKRMVEQMKLSEGDAERAKRDLGIAGGSGSLPKILEPIMQPIVNEIKFAFQLYANMELTELKRVEKIILTGGSSHLAHVPEYLSETLNMNVYRGDPWARVVYPKDLAVVLEEIGPRMAVAVGLAMREMD
ncbi:MAG: type IV pilus assembly protein PilM [Candidatus Uhrbacteria bacterium]|nr:type IV pilus assembly protein PilM [Candidatus Uhrbacteria bacterium]